MKQEAGQQRKGVWGGGAGAGGAFRLSGMPCCQHSSVKLTLILPDPVLR